MSQQIGNIKRGMLTIKAIAKEKTITEKNNN